LSNEHIEHLQFIKRSYTNPAGLNEIIFDITGYIVKDDDWDKSIQLHTYIGKLKNGAAKRKVRQTWGTILHEQAFLYLKEKLKSFGWKLKYGQEIGGKEYDCLGWKGKIEGNPDLAVEMHFPIPKKESYELPFVKNQTWKMRKKLREINARYKYVLIGVPPNRTVTTLEIAHSDMKVVYQRHKFGEIKVVKQKVLIHE
jgi:hypothetical protein